MYNDCNCNDNYERIKKRIEEEQKNINSVIYKDQRFQKVILGFKDLKVIEGIRGMLL